MSYDTADTEISPRYTATSGTGNIEGRFEGTLAQSVNSNIPSMLHNTVLAMSNELNILTDQLHEQLIYDQKKEDGNILLLLGVCRI